MQTTDIRARAAMRAEGPRGRGEGDEQVRCPDTNEMAAYLDEAMDLQERAAWDAHFRRCEKCRRAMVELAGLLELSLSQVDQDVIDAGMSLVPAAQLAAAPGSNRNAPAARG